MSNWQLLVVEDDPDGKELVSRILTYHRIKFDLSSSGEEALEKLQDRDYAGVIIDLALPKIDGWTLLMQIRALYPTVPCIAITAYDSPKVSAKAYEAGFSGYFPKPLNPTALIHHVEKIVNLSA